MVKIMLKRSNFQNMKCETLKLIIMWVLGFTLIIAAQSAISSNMTVITNGDGNTACTDNGVDTNNIKLYSCNSLRSAITKANQTVDHDTISFNIPGGGVQIISPLTLLPIITNPVTITGFTQPGASKNTNSTSGELNAVLMIELDGTLINIDSDTAGGLQINTSDCIIEGLVINNFKSRGISIRDGGNNIIRGNFIGTRADGKIAAGNGDGIGILDSPNNRIGDGLLREARNLISGNTYNGIAISGDLSTGNQVEANFIGTDITGNVELGNGDNGILLTARIGSAFYASDNVIGGLGASYRNVISGNHGSGINIIRGARNIVSGNYIGVNRSGRNELHNNLDGIVIIEGSYNEIGGVDLLNRNVISGNLGAGINISAGFHANDPVLSYGQKNAVGNIIRGNYVGTYSSGSRAVPNNSAGILLISKNDNVYGISETIIGDPYAPEGGNVISGNNGAGIQLDGKLTTDTKIQKNSIGIFIDDGYEFVVGNETHGILIDNGSSNNLIGSISTIIEANTIAFNGGGRGDYDDIEYNGTTTEGGVQGLLGHGVFVKEGINNTIRLNKIYGNEGRGIDLGKDNTFTINDPFRTIFDESTGKNIGVFDSDTGANNLQNFPVVVNVKYTTGKEITWELNIKPGTPLDNRKYTVDFYSNLEPDPSGFGEGKKYLSSLEIISDDGLKRRQFTKTFAPYENYISATATDEFGNTSEFSMVDTDGDALADAWEVPNGGIDIDEDGKIDLDVHALGTFNTLTVKPDHKDIFIETDFMFDLKTSKLYALSISDEDALRKAFDTAPVANADGLSGITLHLLDGGEDPYVDPIPAKKWRNADNSFDWPEEFFRIKNGTPSGDGRDGKFGSIQDRASPNWKNIRAAKRLFVHYAFLSDLFCNFDQDKKEHCYSGMGEYGFALGGNDFFSYGNSSERDVAPTFMHELGHNLGMHHGGRQDDINHKPNYHSIMNYLWTNQHDWMREDLNQNGIFDNGELDINNSGTPENIFVMDYSRNPYPDLDENHLNELVGINGTFDLWVTIGPRLSGPTIKNRIVLETGPVNWNGDIDFSTFEPILENDVEQWGINNPFDTDNKPEILRGHDDWNNLRYYFLESPAFVEGYQNTTPIQEISDDEFLVQNSVGLSNGVLRFSNNQYYISESENNITITLTRGGGTNGIVTVDYATLSGSATADVDYTSVSGTLTFAEGEYLKSFTIPILVDNIDETTENITLTLTNPTGGAILLIAENTSEVLIEDDDGPGVLQFSKPYYDVNETIDIVNVDVTRTAGIDGTTTVDFYTTDASATGGEDYHITSGTLTFEPGQTVASFPVVIITDTETEITERILLSLDNPTGGATLGAYAAIGLNIIDSPVTAGVLKLNAENYDVIESAGSVSVTVNRSVTTEGAITVDYVSSNGSAVNADDYTTVSGTLNFDDGQDNATFDIPILDDELIEGNETFEISLTNATGGAGVQPPSKANIHIIDNEGPGTLQFGNEIFLVSEKAGTATIEVTRIGSSKGVISIDFTTENDTAVEGSDFTSTSGTLTFVDGQASATFNVTIIDDTDTEIKESVKLILSNPSSGALAGNLTTALLSIDDNELPLVVTNVNDSGSGSLHQTILDANSRVGHDIINFNIPGIGVHAIKYAAIPMPVITDSVTIDGYSQPGAQPNSLRIGDNAIILIQLDCEAILTDPGSPGTPEKCIPDRQVFTPFIDGLTIAADNSVIRGLAITNFNGSAIKINSSGRSNIVQGNFLGVDPSGIDTHPNLTGILVHGDSENNLIGGVEPQFRNIISGNIQTGITVEVPRTYPMIGGHNLVQGNYLGTARDGVTLLGNGIGIVIKNSNNVVGGISPGEENIVAGNVAGVQNNYSQNTRGSANVVRGNSIFANDGGIGISGLGSGTKGQQLALSLIPRLFSAISASNSVRISGEIDIAPDTHFELDFYISQDVSRSGFGEGKIYIGSHSITSDETGLATYEVTLPYLVSQGHIITATATADGYGTTGFSRRLVIDDILPVTNTVNMNDDKDDGACNSSHCSLREAIHASNNLPGPGIIEFNIPDPFAKTIKIDSYYGNYLPFIIEELIIDGYSQPGANVNTLAMGNNAKLLIELSGLSRPANHYFGAIPLYANNSTIKGLVINGFDFGRGIVAAGYGNVIQGNFIGTNVTGEFSVANGDGIIIVQDETPTGARATLIGGAEPDERNLISGNLRTGVQVIHDSRQPAEVLIQGNYIGTNVHGTTALSNGLGILIKDSVEDSLTTVVIGGSTPEKANVISGNETNPEIKRSYFYRIGAGSGIKSESTFSTPTFIQGNIIGLDASGVTPISNDVGIVCKKCVIGGSANTGNIIAGNSNSGIVVEGSNTAILSNSVYDNGGLGIDLENNGVTLNDIGDLDTVDTTRQNFPELSLVLVHGIKKIQGTLNSTPDADFVIQYFASNALDPSGYGEGQQFLGEQTTTTDASGNAAFISNIDLSGLDGMHITATATDSLDNTSEFSAVAVAADNYPPFASNDIVVTNQDIPVTIDVLLNDTDADGSLIPSSVLVVRNPGNGSVNVNSLTGVITYTPNISTIGTDSFQYTVEDNLGVVSNAATVTVDVLLPINKLPIASAGLDQTGFIGDIIQLDASASNDPDGDEIFYRWLLIQYPTGSNAVLVNPISKTSALELDQLGIYIAQLIVNDGTVDSISDTAQITALNTLPVADAGPDQQVSVSSLVLLDGNASFDGDKADLTYQWALSSKPLGSVATLTNPSTVNPSFVADLVGSYTFDLIVNDGSDDSLSDSVIITVSNTQPIADAGVDQNAFVGDSVLLDGSASADADDDNLAYFWSLISVPVGSNAVLSDTRLMSPSILIDLKGEYLTQLIVNDGFEDSEANTMTIFVDNVAPIASAGPDQNIKTLADVELDASASSDPDGDLISYLWSFDVVPGGSTLSDSNLLNANSPSPTFTPDVDGEYVIHLVVNDVELEGEDWVVITATTPNTPPNAIAGEDKNVFVYDLVSLNGDLSHDPDEGPQALRFIWTFISKPISSLLTDNDIVDNTNSVTSFMPDVTGGYSLNLNVSDGDASDDDEILIEAMIANLPPIAVAGIDQEVNLGNKVILNGSLSEDPDAGPLPMTYDWAFVSVPTGSQLLNADIVGRDTAFAEFSPDAAGEYVLSLTVRDGNESGINNVLIRVNELEELLPIEDLSGRLKDTKVSLVWSPAPGALSYNIYRNSGVEYTLVTSGYVSDYATYLDSGLVIGDTYCYLVSWINNNGKESLESNEVCVTPTAASTRLRRR